MSPEKEGDEIAKLENAADALIERELADPKEANLPRRTQLTRPYALKVLRPVPEEYYHCVADGSISRKHANQRRSRKTNLLLKILDPNREPLSFKLLLRSQRLEKKTFYNK